MIYRSLSEIPTDFGPCAMSIGNFDGVHRGHQQILKRVGEIARAESWRSAVLTFDPHPAKLVAPTGAPPLLTTPEQRAELMEREGIEEILIVPFDSAIAQLTPEAFAREILVDKLRAREILVGENFRFGYKASGDTQTLQALGEKYRFETEVVPTVTCRYRTISSSEIRRAIQSGEVSQAWRMLGRPYSLEGEIVHGAGIGSKQTVPTLNLDTKAEVLPKTGVYVTRTHDLSSPREWPSITNVGYRPTFNGHGLTIETFLLAPLVGVSPTKISVDFLRWIREERKFDTPEALKSQILRDVSRAQTFHRRAAQPLATLNQLSSPSRTA
jgi:riboflavin kinase / FMN adenylyltransferase